MSTLFVGRPNGYTSTYNLDVSGSIYTSLGCVLAANGGVVGIAKSAPTNFIDVNPTTSSNLTNPYYSGISCRNTTNSAGKNASMLVSVGGSSAGAAYYSAAVTGVGGWSHGVQAGVGRYSVMNNYNFTGTEVMTILTNGNVGIGTTNPGSKLTVNGTLQQTVPVLGRYNSVGISANNNTETVATFDTFDNSYSQGTIGLTYNAGKFTNTSGITNVYLITFHVVWPANSTGARASFIRYNGTARSMQSGELATPDSTSQFITDTLLMNNNDYFEIILFQKSGGTLSTLGGDIRFCGITIVQL